MENMGTEQGGIGILIHEGTCFMNGGQIYGHNGFAALPAELAFGQQLGAGVCILNTGYFEMSAGSITENTASSGAAIYVPDERYTPLKIYSEAYFNNNKATQAAFAYSGRIRHVDVNIFFAHTSLGCHILNNYDINYQTGSLINRHFWDYFPDLNFARVVSEYLDREWEAYIVPCEFSSIKELIANDRQSRSIEGVEYLVEYLTNLEEIQLNDNHILDLSPLGHFDESLNFEAHRQWRKLSAIYVSHQQPHAVYGPSLNHIVIEISEVNIEVEISVVPGEVIFIPVPPKQLEIEILDDSNSIMIVEIPSYQIEVEIPTNPDEGALANIPSYMIKTHIPDKMGSVSKTTVLEQTSWFTFTNATPSILSGKVSSFSIEIILKDFISTTIYKYNVQYFPEKADEQRWWQVGSHALVWWENGRNAAKWKTENFDGYVFQWATPIPINLLFPDINVATRIAQLLHKDIEDIIDITELLHITHLDFHHQSIASLEGLQFLFKLQYLNLRGTGITQSLAEGFLGTDIQYGVNE